MFDAELFVLNMIAALTAICRLPLILNRAPTLHDAGLVRIGTDHAVAGHLSGELTIAELHSAIKPK
jgi:hypothetical protein